jgi:integrase
MARRVGKPLTVKGSEALTKPGMYCDGDGLYLKIAPQGGKSWILRTAVFKRRRDFGLGSFKLVSLAEARHAAWNMRKIARAGGDPETFRTQASFTFEEIARMAFDARRAEFTSEKHERQWWSALATYALPKIGNKPIELIDVRDIHVLLSPIWQTKHSTAHKVKQRISSIFEWAKGAGYYHRENPVAGLSKVLPRRKNAVVHHPSLPWQQLPSFMAELSKREELSASLFEFTILTCVRSGEARGARWEEINGDTWTIPAHRMKTRIEHRVPLSPKCISILKHLSGLDDDFVFPTVSRKNGGESGEMSNSVYKALMNRMGVEGITAHGFRSTFKVWCIENEVASSEVSEHALAHQVGDAVVRAYARSDLFELRRGLMTKWEEYALSGTERIKVKRRPIRRKRVL